MTTSFVINRLIIIGSLIAFIAILYVIRYFISKVIIRKEILWAYNLVIGQEEIQEDAVGVTETEYGTIGVLADGLGKKQAGKISSEYAVREIQDMFIEEGSNEMHTYFFKKAYNKANQEIMKRVEQDKGGASVLSVIIKDGYLDYALVGDVTLAVFRRDELFKISKGHAINEVAKEQYIEGKIQKEKAMAVLKDKKLLFYLGHSSYNNIESNEEPIKLNKNDIVVLMSKGVYKGIRWIELENMLKANKDVKEICNDIIRKVNKQNNGSIILMKYTLKNK